MWSSYRLNAQVEFADDKPVICPTVTTHSFSHSDIPSVLPSHYDIIVGSVVNSVHTCPVFGARVHPCCLSASW